MGRHELEVDARVVGVETDEALDGRRGRQRERAVGRAGRALPERQRGDDELGVEVVEDGGAADDVGDRVDRADLVEVDVVDGGAMDLGLGDGEGARTCAARAPSRPRRGVRAVDHGADGKA